MSIAVGDRVIVRTGWKGNPPRRYVKALLVSPEAHMVELDREVRLDAGEPTLFVPVDRLKVLPA